MTYRVLFLTSNVGIEHDELVKPLQFLQQQHVDCTHAAEKSEAVQTVREDKEPAVKIQPDTTLDQVKATEFDLLVLPGGTVNADTLRINDTALQLIQAFAQAGKPIAAICHAPWTLINAGQVNGKHLTSYQSIQLDLKNAGANWSDQALVRCDHNGYVLLTSRSPDDLPQFNAAILKELQATSAT